MRIKPLAVLILLVCLGSASGQEEGSLDSQRKADQEQLDKQIADYPVLPSMPLKDVVEFRMEHNALAIYTRIPATNGAMLRVPIPELPGVNVIDVRDVGNVQKAGERYQPQTLMFMHHDFTKPGMSEALTTVQISPMNVQVAQDMESPTENRSISIVQTSLGMGDTEPGVHLRVNIQSKSGDTPPLSIDRIAPDLVSLRRQFPAETATYLEPVFRDLFADAVVFGPDHRLAWQVFFDQTTPDPQVTAQVKQVLARLDSDDFHERESAASDLKKLGERAAATLARMDRKGLSAEQNSRIDAFLSTYHPVDDDQANRLRNSPSFLIDCLYDTDNFIVNSALKQLREITGHEIKFDTSLGDNARRDAVAALREKLVPLTTQPAATTQPQ